MGQAQSNQRPDSTAACAVLTGDDLLLTSSQVRGACGGVTAMSLWRWERNPSILFPPPALRINGRKYWSRNAVRQFIAARAADGRVGADLVAAPAAGASIA